MPNLQDRLFSDTPATDKTDKLVLACSTMVDEEGRVHIVLPQDIPSEMVRESSKEKSKAVYIVCKADPVELNIVQQLPEGKSRDKAFDTKNISFNLFLNLR